MNAPQTQMRREINEIPDAVERLLSEGAGAVTATLVITIDNDVAVAVH